LYNVVYTGGTRYMARSRKSKVVSKVVAPAIAQPIEDTNYEHEIQEQNQSRQSRQSSEPSQFLEQLSPEEFALQFFGDGSPRENQEGLPSLEWLKNQFRTKSAAIRYLHSDMGGAHPPKIIAKHLGIRYQHARNVCITELKRGPNEDWRPKQKP
jgi:hypothetical protein